jgi:uncharacterized Zn finger protein
MARLAVAPTVSSDQQTPFAPLSADAIAKQTDSGSFKRGRGYAHSGHIFAAIRRENTLRARCHGSSGGPYLVSATLAEAGESKKQNPVHYACNCPRGGFCKHVVALLLTWVERPETFDVRPPLAQILAGKSHDELVTLIDRLLRDNPELERLIELPLPVAAGPDDGPIDEDLVRRQIAAAFRDDDGEESLSDWEYYEYNNSDEFEGAGTRIAKVLDPLVDTIETYLELNHWPNVFSLATTFIEEVSPHMETIDDEGCDLEHLLESANVALAECLDAQTELPENQRLTAAHRQRLIDALLVAWQTSIDSDFIDMGTEGPEAIARWASLDEQGRVRDQLREYMSSAADSNEFQALRAKATLEFLSQLAGDTGLSPDELLTEYRNAGLWQEAIQSLLRLERVDEAIALAPRHLNARQLLAFTDQLVALGDPDRFAQAMTLVDDYCWEREGKNAQDDQMLLEWMERRYAEQGQSAKAFEIAQRRFKHAPSVATFAAVRAASQLSGLPDNAWSKLRPELISAFVKRANPLELIDIYLAENEIGEAFKALESARKPDRKTQGSYGQAWSVVPEHVELRVAAAAEKNHPDEAVHLYQQVAERRISFKARANYQAAATYLVRVMNLLEKNGRAEDWQTYITQLRDQNKSLRALREELDILGLA